MLLGSLDVSQLDPWLPARGAGSSGHRRQSTTAAALVTLAASGKAAMLERAGRSHAPKGAALVAVGFMAVAVMAGLPLLSYRTNATVVASQQEVRLIGGCCVVRQ